MTFYSAQNRIYNIKSDSLDSREKSHSNFNKPVHANISSPMSENSNSLSGLIANYDSDSEYEDTNGQVSNKLDAKVDNFLQEINQLAPTEKTKQSCINDKLIGTTCVWQECYDESTGYPYYWNVNTNAVTWEMPPEYKLWLTQTKITNNPPLPTNNPIIQTNNSTVSTNNSSISLVNNNKTESSVELVKPTLPVAKEKQNTNELVQRNRNKQKKKTIKKKRSDNSSDSEDEKIVMITSFSEGSSSENESEKPSFHKTNNINKIEEEPQPLLTMGPHIEDIPKDIKETTLLEVPNKKEIIENIKEENIDETVILARLRTQAKVLHELGGELPKSVDKNILSDKIDNINKPQSLCLVAGYGDDSEHSDVEEEQNKKSIFPIPVDRKEMITNEINQSTLFPVTKPIDVKQFELPNNKQEIFTKLSAKETDEELLDNKAFKRKKRLGIAFDIKADKRQKVSENDDLLLDENRRGFGFQSQNDEDSENSNKFSGISFKKGGIAFIKADVLNPSSNDSTSDILSNESEDKIKDFQEIKNIVSEKVHFLGEGKDPVSAVQIMSIQLQTLEEAFKAQGLTKQYLYSWLRKTFKDLEKLEQEAAPEGWICHWDRSNKRYFYRNSTTGETQWHYPALDAAEPDIVGGGEAMDICTTPPPNEDMQPGESATGSRNNVVKEDSASTPSPPEIKQQSPSPPPPPVIIAASENDVQPPIPSIPPPSEDIPPPPPTVPEDQPLPPGVDSPDSQYFAKKEGSSTSTNIEGRNSLGSELDSFYSDIALLEATQVSNSEKSEVESVPSPSSIGENPATEVVKKKKKSKSKIGQGINMKKKAVSSLVEKWKKVQNDYL